MQKIQFTNQFKKSFSKLAVNFQIKFEERLKLFLNDKFNPLLNNHKLQGKYQNLRSFNVTADLRAIFREDKTGEIVLICFIDIGTHSKLY